MAPQALNGETLLDRSQRILGVSLDQSEAEKTSKPFLFLLHTRCPRLIKRKQGRGRAMCLLAAGENK